MISPTDSPPTARGASRDRPTRNADVSAGPGAGEYRQVLVGIGACLLMPQSTTWFVIGASRGFGHELTEQLLACLSSMGGHIAFPAFSL